MKVKHSPLPWKLGQPDRDFKSFIEMCSSMSPDQEKYEARLITTDFPEDHPEYCIVAFFGPGPNAHNNAELIVNAINSEQWSSQQTEDEVYEALEALAKRHKWNGHGVGGCVCKEHLKAEQILARKGNKDGERGG